MEAKKLIPDSKPMKKTSAVSGSEQQQLPFFLTQTTYASSKATPLTLPVWPACGHSYATLVTILSLRLPLSFHFISPICALYKIHKQMCISLSIDTLNRGKGEFFYPFSFKSDMGFLIRHTKNRTAFELWRMFNAFCCFIGTTGERIPT